MLSTLLLLGLLIRWLVAPFLRLPPLRSPACSLFPRSSFSTSVLAPSLYCSHLLTPSLPTTPSLLSFTSLLRSFSLHWLAHSLFGSLPPFLYVRPLSLPLFVPLDFPFFAPSSALCRHLPRSLCCSLSLTQESSRSNRNVSCSIKQ